MTGWTTARCSLSPLSESDFDEAAALFTDENVRRYLGGILSEAAAREKLAKWSADMDSLYFTVRRLSDGAFLGLADVSPHHDPANKELSYQFLPQYWGHGYASETLASILDYCGSVLGIHRIVSETQSANTRSCKLLENLGYILADSFERFGAQQNLYVFEYNSEKISKNFSNTP